MAVTRFWVRGVMVLVPSSYQELRRRVRDLLNYVFQDETLQLQVTLEEHLRESLARGESVEYNTCLLCAIEQRCLHLHEAILKARLAEVKAETAWLASANDEAIRLFNAAADGALEPAAANPELRQLAAAEAEAPQLVAA
jgi:hypothetical protein